MCSTAAVNARLGERTSATLSTCGHTAIALLSYIAKLFERMMLRMLRDHLSPRHEKFGFRSGHSTNLQLG
ncbi:hypothetical protein EVAR_58131_1 [Eumeta japonica]|uniref:Uncharacterized protein n=1 Tax=Eumeta variegata TaxID=151549 RepID=A0A4C1YS74_EUMVA|nr:hypothetical protein EVAR_58131_1 [Eumeta japonica]